MQVTVTYRDGMVERHSTDDSAIAVFFKAHSLATTIRLRTDSLADGLWAEVYYHDMAASLVDDTIASAGCAMDIANPTDCLKLWLVPADAMHRVASISVDGQMVAQDLGAGHLVDLTRYLPLARFCIGDVAMGECRRASELFSLLSLKGGLDPREPGTVTKVARMIGWEPEDLSLALEMNFLAGGIDLDDDAEPEPEGE